MKKRIATIVSIALSALTCIILCACLSACDNPTEHIGGDPTHTHSYTSEVVAPTCVERGYMLHTCECGNTYKDTYTETVAHSYGEWEITTPATCTEAGEKKQICSVCDDEKIETIDALGHSYGEWEITTPATCTEAGEKKQTCSVCGDKKSETIAALGHTYGEWETTTPATCTAAGEQKHTCAVCGDKKSETIAALGHSYSEGICTVCCAKESGGFQHTYGEWEITTPATCTEAGEKKQTCSVCGDKKSETIDALGHSYSEGICTVCCAKENGGFQHTYGEWKTTTPATCTTPGERKQTCSRGG